MERAAAAARIGNQILSALAAVLILFLLLLGGYSLWYDIRVRQGAFLSDELMQYKPTASVDGENPTLEELADQNPDVRGWLTIEGTGIDYPVVQGKNDMEYVNKDVSGDFSLSGSIFLSCLNSGDFSDSYSLVYGHHMDNGAMFGDVTEFTEESYFREHGFGTLYLPEETDTITIFACMEPDAYDSRIYPASMEAVELSSLLRYIEEHAVQYREIGVTGSDRIIALSTCAQAMTNGRVVLFGRLDRTDPIQEGGT